jgi:hypothetical protein
LFEDEQQRIKAINAFASHQLNMYEQEEDPERKKRYSHYGYKLIDNANSILQFDPGNVISMCFYKIAAGQLKEAQQYLDEQQKHHLSNVNPRDVANGTQSAV